MFAYERLIFPAQSLTVLKQWLLWVCYCFGLIGICCLVAQRSGKNNETGENVFSAIRERPFRFLKSASLFFVVLIFAYLALCSIIAAIAILQMRTQIPFAPWEATCLSFVAAGLVSAVLVRWAFTVPVVVLNGLSFRRAMTVSDRLTDYRTIALWALLMESELTGYMALVGPSYVLFHLHVQPSAFTYYTGEAIAVLLSVMTQAPFMIAIGLVLAGSGASLAADSQS